GKRRAVYQNKSANHCVLLTPWLGFPGRTPPVQ
ncbi:MAG: hypothetical protein ACI88G_001609, partial [Woeseiaceae bacterium]